MEELEIVLEKEGSSEVEIDLIKEGAIIYPQLEDLTIKPSSVEQTFKHPNSYGYDEVRVEAVESETLEITPSLEEQNYVGLYGVVNVEAIPNTYIEPTGTLKIIENGEYNVREFEKVDVQSGYILKVEKTTINFEKGAKVNGNEVVL